MIIVNGIMRGEFLNIPYVAPAAGVGITSMIAGVALHSLGFSVRSNVVTATFVVTGTMGLTYVAFGIIAYAVFANAMYRGQDRW